MMFRHAILSSVAVAPLALVVASALGGQTITVTYTFPSADRWNYPFNPSPCCYPNAPVFGNEAGSPLFDNRDGQMVIVFDTAADIPPGNPLPGYQIDSCRLTLQFATDNGIQYDDTTDPWQTFVPRNDPNFMADRDPGQPTELFGTGFRNGFSLLTWQEDSPYAPAGADITAPGVRNAYSIGQGARGRLIDVSDSVREQFSPTPFAVGFVPGVAVGDPIPIGSLCIFDLAIKNPLVHGYLQENLSEGKLSLSVTSLAKVVQQGPTFPAFYCKEDSLVKKGLAQAAKLELTVTVLTCKLADFDCDGIVGPADLALMLGAWGTSDPQFDLSGDGTVGPADVAILLGEWG